jgi:hypothetical protein
VTLEQSKAHFLNYCKHFPAGGVSNPTCDAGVNFKDVREGGKLPCLISHSCCDRCSKFETRSEADAEEYAQQSEARLQEFFDRLASNKCPHCGVEVEEKIQIGPCVYAKPCNHRMYQGKV